MLDPVILKQQETSIGSTIEVDGNKYLVDREFTQGADAKGSNYQYLMNSIKGVYGLKEVVSEPEPTDI